jgi:putative ABC transport system permease protein
MLSSIVLSVATVTAVGKSIVGAREAYGRLSASFASQTDLVVTSRAGEGISPDAVSRVAETAGVKSVSPVSRNATIMYVKNQRLRVVAVGVKPENASQSYDIVAGHGLSDKLDLLIDEQLARELAVQPGDLVKLLTPRGMARLTIAGIVRSRGLAALGGTTIVFMPLDQVPSLFRRARSIDSLEVTVDGSDPVNSVENSLRKSLATAFPSLEVRHPDSDELLGMDTLRTIETGLKLASMLAFVIGMFMVLNAFLINLGERRRHVALLRIVGASRGQVLATVLLEAIVLGLGGTVIGLPVGAGLCWVLDRVLSVALSIPIETSSSFDPTMAWSAIAIGVIGTLAAALYPAWRATRIHPLEALTPSIADEHTRSPRWCLAVAALLLTLSVAGWAAADRYPDLPQLTYLASATFLLGLIFAIPPLLSPLARLAAGVLQPWIGLPADLARRQVISRPLRSTMTVGIVLVGLTSGIAIGNTVRIHISNVDSWWARNYVHSFYLRALLPDLSMATSSVEPPDLRKELTSISGVTGVETLRLLSVTADDQRVILFVRDYGPMPEVHLALVEGTPSEVLQGIRQGGVVVGSVFAYRHDLHLGAELALATEKGPQPVKVVGISSEYIAGGNVIHMDRVAANRLYHADGADVYAISVVPGSAAAVEPQLRAIAEESGLMLLSLAEMTSKVDRMMTGVTASLWGVLIVGLLIMAFGVATTISMNVLEQMRELSLLRIVGSSSSQIIAVVISQAWIVLLLGAVPAVFAGLWICYVTNRSSLAISGYLPAFYVDVPMVVGAIAAAALMVLLAALGPARRVAYAEPLLINYE